MDPSVLPQLSETKGSLTLRSTHPMKYGRATLNTDWHADREAEPRDYEIRNRETKDRNLLKSSYTRVGNVTDGSLKGLQTTQHEAMDEVGKLKEDYRTRDIHKAMISEGNFSLCSVQRETGKPERGYGSVLPRHELEHRMQHFQTTHQLDFQYPFEWTTQSNVKEEEPQVRFHRSLSEFADTDGHKRFGINTFRDGYGTIDIPNNV